MKLVAAYAESASIYSPSLKYNPGDSPIVSLNIEYPRIMDVSKKPCRNVSNSPFVITNTHGLNTIVGLSGVELLISIPTWLKF